MSSRDGGDPARPTMPDEWEEAVNPLRVQVWLPLWSGLCGLLMLVGAARVLGSPPSDPAWAVGWFAIGVACGMYPVFFFVFWSHRATYYFAADRIGVRTWWESLRGVPPRIFPLTPDLTVVFSKPAGVVIRTAQTSYHTDTLWIPSKELLRLVDVLEARHIKVEYEWRPRKPKGPDTRSWIDRWTGPPL